MNINKLKKWAMMVLTLCTATFVVLFCVLASWVIMYEGTALLMDMPYERHVRITFSLALAAFLLWLQMLAIDSALWLQQAGIEKANNYGEGL